MLRSSCSDRLLTETMVLCWKVFESGVQHSRRPLAVIIPGVLICVENRISILLLAIMLLIVPAFASSGAAWRGTVSDGAGKPVGQAVVKLRGVSGAPDYSSDTAANGKFVFAEIAAGSYEVSVQAGDMEWKTGTPLVVKDASPLDFVAADYLCGSERRGSSHRAGGTASRRRPAGASIFRAPRSRACRSMCATSASCCCWRRAR